MGQFYEKLDAMAEQGRFLHLGLDPKPGMLPEGFDQMQPYDAYYGFLTSLTESVQDVVAGIKPNKAFYLGLDKELGGRGLELFSAVIDHAAEVNPDLVRTSDSKDADIATTNTPYAVSAFDNANADAITTNPYFGAESMKPLTDREDRGVIPVVRTSNPGTEMTQDVPVSFDNLQSMRNRDEKGTRTFTDEQMRSLMEAFDTQDFSMTIPYFAAIASQIRYQWNSNNNCAVVAGATYPEELEIMRRIVGEKIPILIPGVGAQGGLADVAAFNGVNGSGGGIMINESRSLMYASTGTDFREATRSRALQSTELILAGLDRRRAK